VEIEIGMFNAYEKCDRNTGGVCGWKLWYVGIDDDETGNSERSEVLKD
jgi:hypothetical protein